MANDSQLAQLLNNMHNQLRESGVESDEDTLNHHGYAGRALNAQEIDRAIASGIGLNNDSKLESMDARNGDEMDDNYRDIGTMENQQIGTSNMINEPK